MKKKYISNPALGRFIGMMVVCDQRAYCNESEQCGGCIPHWFDENECGKCPFNKEAKCYPTEKEE